MLAALCVAARAYSNPPSDLEEVIRAQPAFDHADLIDLIRKLGAIDARWKHQENREKANKLPPTVGDIGIPPFLRREPAPADAAEASSAPAAGDPSPTKH
jgi:hypothetical protein